MADPVTSLLGVTKPALTSIADVQVLEAGFDTFDAAASPNLLTNGGCEVWQRGAGPFTVAATHTADRWLLALSVSTAVVTRETTDVDAGSGAALKFAYSHGATGFGTVNQKIEDWAQLRGRTVTFTARVKCTVVGRVRLRTFDGSLQTSGAYNATTDWETLSVTVDVPATATEFDVYVRCDIGSCTVLVDNASLHVGAAAVAYAPMHVTDDLARCQRYYFELGGLSTTEYAMLMQCTSGTIATGSISLPVEMALAPTVTVSVAADWSVLDAGGNPVACTVLAAGVVTRRTARITATVAAGLVAGDATNLRANTTLVARIAFEANPV